MGPRIPAHWVLDEDRFVDIAARLARGEITREQAAELIDDASEPPR